MAFKEQQHGKPEVTLQSEINLLTLEKVNISYTILSVYQNSITRIQSSNQNLSFCLIPEPLICLSPLISVDNFT